MSETYEKGGVIFFKEPYRVDCIDWAASHENCYSVVSEKSEYVDEGCGEVFFVYCYASTPKYNDILLSYLNSFDVPVCVSYGLLPSGGYKRFGI